MSVTITEIQIIPIRPHDGLVAFASFVLNEDLYLGSIGIMTKLGGGYRLTYPTRKVENTSISIFHPINRDIADTIAAAVIARYEALIEGKQTT